MFRPLRSFYHWLTDVLGVGGILCDNCKYDYGSACKRPERPNARRCPDYKPR